ncbi:cysteine synthase [Candidatus Rickettsiella viridis]|uniref:Cysteine synthase B n=1 Tax=Candidatus Rickettsiella viridis TaxID=676208 RepID=A0A2Z5V411_9COXI|nr:cysteine synthase family protein [Candidatus Rickettsiella viridis]BBB15182.1 cysteine synthase [Candidatus Rickettsiella viridis]
MSFKTILQSIGNTPLVKLDNISPNKLATILVKCEFMNPSGSIKDRIVSYIINDAEQRGLLKPGGTIVENTSGNTGAAIAMIAAIKGYKVILTMPDKVSQEKQNALKAYGAEIVVTPTSAAPDSPDHYVNVAKRLAKETANSFSINQYDNPKNPEAHYHTTGPEIWQQVQGQCDILIASGSTGGTISGVGRFLKEKNPNIKVIMPDPKGSIYYDYFKTGKVPESGNCSYFVEGVGEDHLAKAMNFSVLDDVIPFVDKDAFSVARRLAKEEGLLVGGSAGANVWAALKVAEKVDKPTTIVTILPDGGVKYLSKVYNNDWMKAHGLI